MRRSPATEARRLCVVAAAAAMAVAGCGKEPIPVLDPVESAGGDFGRGEVLAAVETFRATPTSPRAYALLAEKIAALRPTMDEQTGALADRLLTFLALGPLEAHNNRPPEERVEMLAATVWPFALGPAPLPDEGGHAYLERICAGELAGECKYMVPEMWPLLMGAKVWRRFRLRAQEAYAYCRPCQNDDSYRRALARFDEIGFPLESEAAERNGDGHPRQWPRSEGDARAWEDGVVTIEVDGSGTLRISNREVPAKEWRDVLARRHRDNAVGIYLRPGASVALLRDFVGDLGGLGYGIARLQVRDPAFPYRLGYLPLATRRGARGATRVPVRSTDTIQVAVLAIEDRVGELGATELIDLW
jgi:hypothetical protein